MLTMPDVLTAIADLFGQLGLGPLLALALILALVALLARRVKAAVQTAPDDPLVGYASKGQDAALDGFDGADVEEFHRLLEEDTEFAALVATWSAEGQQQVVGDNALE
jgi:hypothetical protein